MSPMTDVREISKIAYGFIGTQALVTGLDLNLFGILGEQSLTIETLESQTSIPSTRFEFLLTPLVALGILEKSGDNYTNSPAAARYLDPDQPEYFGEYIRLQVGKQIYPHALNMHAALKGTPVQLYHEVAEDEKDAADFTHSQHIGSLGPAHLVSRSATLDAPKHMLDIAGGSGAFTIRFLEKYPDLRATILDFPKVTEVAREYISDSGLTDRVDYLEGNALELGWPQNQDAILMSYLLSAVGRKDIENLMTKAFASLQPGGTLLLHDFMVDDDKAGPTSASLWMLVLISSPQPALLTPAYLISAAEAAGFTDINVEVTIPTITSCLTAKKP